MGLCSDLMQEAGVPYNALAGIGVGIGPGNFTGVRISVSAARGMALGLGVPANGVSLLEALAYGAPLPCLTAVDARRGQVYVQGFGQDVCADPQVVDANALPAFEGALIGAGGIDPAHPRAVAIAHLAAARLGTLQPRPAPLYLRAPDAAPAREGVDGGGVSGLAGEPFCHGVAPALGRRDGGLCVDPDNWRGKRIADALCGP